jgi:hypothetical protein
MTWLLENPWPIIGVGVLVEVLLLATFLNTQRAGFLVAIGAVFGVVLLGVLIEWLVVTETEEVENTLLEVAAALESNDLERVLSYMAPEAEPMRRTARRYLSLIEVNDANVGSPEITFNRVMNPPTAKARFFGTISFRSGPTAEPLPYENYARHLVVHFRRDRQRWLLTKYEDGLTSEDR